MNELQIFNYEGANVRTVWRDGEPWWVLRDVCAVFGETDHKRVKQRLDEDEVGGAKVPHPQSDGKELDITVVSEAGLYSALFAMRPGKARGVSEEYIAERQEKLRRFKRWVTHEVLPSIRRTGMYATVEAAEKLLNDPDFLIGALEEIKAVRAKNAALTETVQDQQKQIAEMEPKAKYCDVILACPDAVTVSVIAKDYGWSAIRLNGFLHDNCIQYKQGRTWLLYQRYAGMGYTCTHTHNYTGEGGASRASVHTLWTQRGRLFLYEFLKDCGVLPLMEVSR